MKRILLTLVAIASMIGLIVGCGGSSASAVGNNVVNLFATDDLRTGYDHVWGTIYKIQLVGVDASTTTVYDDPNGKTLDFISLHDGAGARFAFLGKGVVSNKVYTSVNITLADSMTLFTTGAATGTTHTIDAPTAGTGKVLVTFNLSNAQFADDSSFVVDFDLANFVITAGKIVPSLRRGDDSGLDDEDRHEHEDVHGIVSSVTGTTPDLTFDMRLRNDRILTVKTSSSTRIFNGDGSPNPVITVGKRLEVTGRLDTVAGVYNASSIKIEDANDEDEDKVKGLVMSANGSEFFLVVDATFARGFQPTSSEVTVTTSTSTTFRDNNGLPMTRADFFALFLRGGVTIEAEGNYNAQSNELAATKIHLEDGVGGGDDRQVEAEGRVNSVDLVNHTVTMNVSEYEGFSFGGGTLLTRPGESVKYMDDDNNELTQDQFFAALTANKKFDVRGKLVEGAIVGNRFRLKE